MNDKIAGDAKVEALKQSCLEHMYQAFVDWSQKNTPEQDLNAFYLVNAFAEMWCVVCGALPREIQHKLLRHWHVVAHTKLQTPHIEDADERKRQ